MLSAHFLELTSVVIRFRTFTKWSVTPPLTQISTETDNPIPRPPSPSTYIYIDRINTKLTAKDLTPMRDLIPDICDGTKLIQVSVFVRRGFLLDSCSIWRCLFLPDLDRPSNVSTS